MRPLSALMMATLLAAAIPAAAQSPAPGSSDSAMFRSPDRPMFQAASMRRRPPVKKQKIGVRVYGIVEDEMLAATKSFSAVLGTSRVLHVGAGADILHLGGGGAFARVDGTHASRSGSRVFVDSTQHAFSLNVPITVSMTPIEIGGGWRFMAFDRRGRIVPYVGATGVWLRYGESSALADPGDDVRVTLKGASLFGGVEVTARRLCVAVEGVYRYLPNAIGAAGASGAFNEDNLGGTAIRVRFGIGL